MASFLAHRLGQSILTLSVISVVVFFMVHAAPGGPIAGHMRQPRISGEQIERLREEYGLKDPIPVRYFKWLSHVLRGDLGYSLSTKRSVAEELGDRLGNTVYLMSVTFLVVIVLSSVIGILSSLRPYSIFDLFATAIAFVGQSVPEFWIGVLLLSIFYGILTNPFTGRPLLPYGGIATFGEEFSFIDRASHLILPVITLSFAWTAWYSRFIRSSMLDVLGQDYITAARARGLSERLVILRHAFRNAQLPLITLIALDLPALFAGALYVEIVYSWPGMGRLFFESATRRDYPVLLAIVMISACLIVLGNLLADIAYGYLNPQIRFEKGYI